MRTYKKKDILHVLKGAAFLGGGGASLTETGAVLEEYEKRGYAAEADVCSFAEMKTDSCGIAVDIRGDLQKTDPDMLAENLVQLLMQNREYGAEADGAVRYLYPAQLTADSVLLTFLAAMVGKKSGISCLLVDTAANGRWIPDMRSHLSGLRGMSPVRLIAAWHEKDGTNRGEIYPVENAEAAEAILQETEDRAEDAPLFLAWESDPEEIDRYTGIDYIQYACRVGETLENRRMPLYDALHAVIPQIKEIFCGRIEAVFPPDAGKPDESGEISGVSCGRVILAGNGELPYRIGIAYTRGYLFAGEYRDGKISDIYMTAPDIISLVDTDSRLPLSAGGQKELQPGRPVTVFLTPAHYYWWDEAGANRIFADVLRHCGCGEETVRYDNLYVANRGKDPQKYEMLFQVPFAGKSSRRSGELLPHLQADLYDGLPGWRETVIGRDYGDDEQQAAEPTVSEADAVRNGPLLLKLTDEGYLDQQKSKPWTGHYISHFADEMTLRGIREASSRIVFDSFVPAVLVALALGERIGILTWPCSAVPLLARRIAGEGLADRVVRIEGIDSEKTPELKDVLQAAQNMEKDDIQCLIIGRGFLTDGSAEEYRMAERLEAALGGEMPVVDANRAGMRWLELNAHMNYFHSRRTYFVPPEKGDETEG